MQNPQPQIEDDQLSDQMTNPARVRSLGSTEHLFWLLDQNRPTHFAMVAEIDRRFSLDAWHAAFRVLQRRHPLLSTYIGVDTQSNSSFYSKPDAAIPLRVVDQIATSWHAEVAREIATRFDWSAAPLLRATLLQGEHDSALILVAHHSVVDGKGGAYLIEDLLHALSGESLPPLPLVESLEAVLERDIKAAAVLPEAPLAPTPRSFRPGAAELPHVDAIELPAELTRRLIERAHTERTTVHGAIAAAVNEACRRLSPEWSTRALRTVSPIDVRYLADEIGISDGVYITQTITVDHHPRGTSLWTAARKVKQDLAPAQTHSSAVAELKALDAAMSARPSVQHAAGFLSAVLAFDVLLSNLGNQPIPSVYKSVSLQALWGPCVTSGFADDQMIGVCTVAGILRVTHTSYGAISGLLGELKAILEEALVA
ncbi:phthiocerol/phthiodiolone dimycocerosyl transferase family protein [Paraburkholderia caffeinilytica]|uniref:phthiocerol/phthiodiolone dimycocerosyl transferase family protein n=1 Tax=Paraburkholderia caffeinilytica TaxID=1761016 RepID=UPI0038BC7D88